jgi:SM-20-related protein
MLETIELSAIKNSDRKSAPYDYLLGEKLLKKEVIQDIVSDFPAITKPGYLTVEEVDLRGKFKILVEELEGPELTEELSKRFERDLHPYPRLTTIMKTSQSKYGAIHTDGESKIMTFLVYLNDMWETDEGGRLRVLYNGEHFEPYALEVPPTMGNFFGFLRSENSWHGHLPFAGQRRVVQVAWIRSQADLERKRKHNRVAQLFKGIFGR